MRRVDILNTTSPAGACIRPGRKLYGKRREEIRLSAGAWTGLAPRGSADGTPSFYVSVGEVRSAVGLIECCRGKAPPRSYRLPPHGRAAGRRGACQPAGASDLVSWPAPLRQESARNSAQDDRPLRLGPDCNPDPRPSDRISPRGAFRQPPAAAYGSTASPRGWTPYAAGHHMRRGVPPNHAKLLPRVRHGAVFGRCRPAPPAIQCADSYACGTAGQTRGSARTRMPPNAMLAQHRRPTPWNHAVLRAFCGPVKRATPKSIAVTAVVPPVRGTVPDAPSNDISVPRPSGSVPS